VNSTDLHYEEKDGDSEITIHVHDGERRVLLWFHEFDHNTNGNVRRKRMTTTKMLMMMKEVIYSVSKAEDTETR
jgi:hypothetical protein